MNTKKNLMIGAALVAAIAAGYGLYALGMQKGKQLAAPAAAQAQTGTIDPASGRRVLYWHDPMVPGQKFDKPGKSPFMDMDLVPVYADEQTDQGQIAVSARMQQSLGIRTAEVSRGKMAAKFEAVGSVAYNERDVALIQARSNGFVEKLYVRTALDRIKKGQALAELYVPEWIAVQEEYLAVKRMRGAGAESLLDGARQRMRLAGMSEEQIRQVDAVGRTQARLVVSAPVSGIVAELSAREGMTVMSGAPLFRINGMETVWVNAELPENLAARLKPGDEVEARSQALPDAVFKGKINALLPEVSASTRTIKARIELHNRGGQLIPGMFVTVNLKPTVESEVLLVPSEAIIQTGKRNVVIAAQEEGKFAPVEVDIGGETGGQTEIRKGLAAGQKVVVSGQFLIDSEASLKGVLHRMNGEAPSSNAVAPGTSAPAPEHDHSGAHK
ncbi:MAG: efflux RND transporter periplasmic adaptor subunit [Burkholderiales bacterium]|nr:efflux RND transporter periplasmic adaptor subunit [Burkholderiales bacterium]